METSRALGLDHPAITTKHLPPFSRLIPDRCFLSQSLATTRIASQPLNLAHHLEIHHNAPEREGERGHDGFSAIASPLPRVRQNVPGQHSLPTLLACNVVERPHAKREQVAARRPASPNPDIFASHSEK